MKPYYKYVDDVLSGNVITGANIQLACQRFQEDLNRDDLEFRESVVDRAISFISTMKHFKGKASGQNFILEPWQQFVVANIVGFYWKGTMIEDIPVVILKFQERMERQPQLLLCAYIS